MHGGFCCSVADAIITSLREAITVYQLYAFIVLFPLKADTLGVASIQKNCILRMLWKVVSAALLLTAVSNAQAAPQSCDAVSDSSTCVQAQRRSVGNRTCLVTGISGSKFC
jgi:hypothetical protein